MGQEECLKKVLEAIDDWEKQLMRIKAREWETLSGNNNASAYKRPDDKTCHVITHNVSAHFEESFELSVRADCWVVGQMLPLVTEKGQEAWVDVEQLKVGDKINSANGTVYILRIDVRDYEGVVCTLRTAQSGKLKVTPKHDVCVPGPGPGPDGGAKPARSLALNDEVICGTRASRLTKVAQEIMKTRVVEIEFDRDVPVRTMPAEGYSILSRGAPRGWQQSKVVPSMFETTGSSATSSTVEEVTDVPCGRSASLSPRLKS